jgi:hypothetical protein
MNSSPLEIGKLIGREKSPELELFIAVKQYPEDFDVNRVLSLLPIMVVARSGVGTAQKRVCQNQSQQGHRKR